MNFQIASGFLCLYILGLTASEECVNKYVGESYTFKLNSPQQDGDMLIWKCEDKIIYKRRRGKAEPKANVDVQGSLTLTNISKSMNCTYKAEHHDSDGKALKTRSESLCVFSKIPDPKLEVKCSSGMVALQCGPSLPEGITLTWLKNNNEMKNEKSNPLKPQKPGVKDRYKCRLSNGLDKDTRHSKEEAASCAVSGGVSNNNLLFGYNKWVMIGIIAGGGFLLLVLIVSLIAICCKNHRRSKRKQRDEQELRLANLQYTGTNPRARPKQTARGQPVPPTPDEEGYLQGPIGEHSPSPAAPQAARQPRPRAPAPPMEDDDEAVPPLPQPRKKGPRHPDY
ncbi:T-cell surface antigen CD2-like [Sardina pilchardus]|uniref:T-cell surface antigen CD2-like n=1 Tax=Sardina pilchardus TaxID=27697 RepID=UPI002E0E4029